MKNELPKKTEFGLLGRNISYSFSRTYFREKFKMLKINASYDNFDISKMAFFPKIIKENPYLKGLNVTIPYKEEIIPFLDEIDSQAKQIGAVNTIVFGKNGVLKGFNTDYFGFTEALKPFLKPYHKKALVLGTGGASKAILFALKELNIAFSQVSRNPNKASHTYKELDENIMKSHLLIINCTPLGTFPNTQIAPDIPIEYLTKNHLIFDLVYNPATTQLMKQAAEEGAVVTNGLRMLEFQAEKAWELWNTRNS